MTITEDMLEDVRKELRKLGKSEDDLTRLGTKCVVTVHILVNAGYPLMDMDLPEVFVILSKVFTAAQRADAKDLPKC